MKAEELRIGNIVTHKSELHKIAEISYSGYVTLCRSANGELVNTYLEHVEPTPLSPELLVRCGFRKDGDRWEGEINIYLYREGIYRLCVDEFGALDCDIKYLHQLQNITYWLTSGTELTLAL